VKTLTEKTIAI